MKKMESVGERIMIILESKDLSNRNLIIKALMNSEAFLLRGHNYTLQSL